VKGEPENAESFVNAASHSSWNIHHLFGLHHSLDLHCRLLMLSKRIIACLDVRDGRVVKGINFESLREAGDPAQLAARYDREGIDEVVILDVTATLETRQARAHTIAAVSRELFLPLAVGGGIRSEEDAAAAIEAGADKVSLNTAALQQPDLITALAMRFGSQAVIVAIDAKRAGDRFAVYVRSGTDATSRDAVEWAREAADRGAGEILLTSIDRDGTKRGFDCLLTAAVSTAVPIPVIASGGAGEFEHFAEVFTAGRADAALAASIFHYNEKSVAALKQFLAARGIPVRLLDEDAPKQGGPGLEPRPWSF
jgi:cyclase